MVGANYPFRHFLSKMQIYVKNSINKCIIQNGDYAL